MMTPHTTKHPHHMRFYIVMTTIVIGGIFLLLLANNDGNNFGITGAFTSEQSTLESDLNTIEGNNFETGTSASDDEPDTLATNAIRRIITKREVKDEIQKEMQKESKEVEISLTFDQIPQVSKEAKLDEMELSFDDLTTRINVNDDKLELNNLQQVTLRIEGFIGDFRFDSTGLSLNGKAKRLEVNDVALSAKKDIKISFDNLDYQKLTVGSIELQDVVLEEGNGQLSVENKLTYTLDSEAISLYLFNGKLNIDRSLGTALTLEGIAKGIGISGDILNLDVR